MRANYVSRGALEEYVGGTQLTYDIKVKVLSRTYLINNKKRENVRSQLHIFKKEILFLDSCLRMFKTMTKIININ